MCVLQDKKQISFDQWRFLTCVIVGKPLPCVSRCVYKHLDSKDNSMVINTNDWQVYSNTTKSTSIYYGWHQKLIVYRIAFGERIYPISCGGVNSHGWQGWRAAVGPCSCSPSSFGHTLEELTAPLGPLHTRAQSRDHGIVRAQKKVFKGRPNTPPKSCIVVTDPQVYCEVICDHALNKIIFQWISIHADPHTW